MIVARCGYIPVDCRTRRRRRCIIGGRCHSQAVIFRSRTVLVNHLGRDNAVTPRSVRRSTRPPTTYIYIYIYILERRWWSVARARSLPPPPSLAPPLLTWHIRRTASRSFAHITLDVRRAMNYSRFLSCIRYSYARGSTDRRREEQRTCQNLFCRTDSRKHETVLASAINRPIKIERKFHYQ